MDLMDGDGVRSEPVWPTLVSQRDGSCASCVVQASVFILRALILFSVKWGHVAMKIRECLAEQQAHCLALTVYAAALTSALTSVIQSSVTQGEGQRKASAHWQPLLLL